MPLPDLHCLPMVQDALSAGGAAPPAEHAGGTPHLQSGMAAPLAPPSRLAWPDVLRGLAVLGMLHTHVSNMFLAPAWKSGVAYDWLSFFHGLVAPAFLWVAGHVHGLGLWRRFQSPHPAFPWRTVRRLGVVWLIGYALHLPWSGTRAAWTAFLATDVLQCLAASLIAITALEFPLARLFPPKARRAAAIATLGALALASVFLAPSANVLSCGWFAIDAYTDTTGPSLFPLLPWFGFVAIGVLGAAVPTRWNWLIIALAVAACFCPQPGEFSKMAPAFFVQRLGFLVVGAQAVAWAAGRWTAPGWLVLAGRESLVVYVGHLVLLHWFPWAEAIGPVCTPLQVNLLFLGLTLASLGLARGSVAWKKARR